MLDDNILNPEPHRCSQEGSCDCKLPAPTEADMKRVQEFMFKLDVDVIVRHDPPYRMRVIVAAIKDFTDEQVRELILELQKALSNR